MIIGANTIKELSLTEPKLLNPFLERQKYYGVSRGLGFAGYDVGIEFDEKGIIEDKIVEPGEFFLASTIEFFNMPNDLIAFAHDKSSWARRGITVQNTVIEPGWSGYLTLEIKNIGNEQVPIFRGQGIAQIIFHKLSNPVNPYRGKYHNQERGPVSARS